MIVSGENPAKGMMVYGLTSSLVVAVISWMFSGSIRVGLALLGIFFLQLVGTLICYANKKYRLAFLFACGPIMAAAALPVIGIFTQGKQLASAVWYLLFHTPFPW